jgi:hypothetical protein
VTGSIAASSAVQVAGGAVLETASVQSMNGVTLDLGAKLVVSAGSLKVGNNVDMFPLFVAGSGSNYATVDVTTAGLVIDVPPVFDGITASTIRTLVTNGYNGGSWSGTGITSSAAAADASKGVGYARAADVLGPAGGAFMGQTVDGSATLVRYTLVGDSTLDGRVNFNDLVRLAQNYNNVDGNRTWYDGDYNYDGKVDFNDLVKLAQNYNAAIPAGGAVAGATAEFEADLAAAAFAQAPEPAALWLLAGGVALGIGRRGRRRTRGVIS